MRRTFMESLTGLFSEVRELRTFPDMPALALMSDGTYRATFHNPEIFTEKDEKAFGHAEIDGKEVSAYRAEDLEYAHTRLRKADDRVLAALFAGASAGFDKGPFAATLSSGDVAIRIPEEGQDLIGDVPLAMAETFGNIVYLVRSEDFPRIPEALDAVNAADIQRIKAEKAWAQQQKLAQRSDLFDVSDAGIMVEFSPRHTDLRDHLVSLGGKVSPNSTESVERVWLSKALISEGDLKVEDVHARHQKMVAEVVRKKKAEEAAARKALHAKLVSIGVDASWDPSWVSRNEKGDAIMLIPSKAIGLLNLLEESGGVIRETPGRGHKGVTFSHEAFSAIKATLPLIENEIRSVRDGAAGDEKAMKSRIESAATFTGRQKVKDTIQTAKRSRQRGGLSIAPAASSNLNDPMSPLNPFGIHQMLLWSSAAEQSGAEQQARDSGVKVKEGGSGEMVIEPPRGGDTAWQDSSPSHSPSSDSSSSSSSSSYDGGSSYSSSSDSSSY